MSKSREDSILELQISFIMKEEAIICFIFAFTEKLWIVYLFFCLFVNISSMLKILWVKLLGKLHLIFGIMQLRHLMLKRRKRSALPMKRLKVNDVFFKFLKSIFSSHKFF
jgi:hypothetical protein